jgi:uncharacterized repeat protein (TIGR01451 family)
MKYARLLLSLLVLWTAIAPYHASIANAADPPLQFVHYPCGYGALLVPQAYCIHGRVILNGASLQDIEVIATWKDKNNAVATKKDRTRQRPNDPLGQAGFTLVLPPETPKDAQVMLRAVVNNQNVKRSFLLSPDPISLSQEIDLIADLAPLPPLIGRVFYMNRELEAGESVENLIRPLTGVTVTLSYTPANSSEPISRTVQTTAIAQLPNEPLFSFNDQISAGTQVTLAATHPTSPSLQVMRSFVLESLPTLVDLHLGWDCDYTIPVRSPKGLPDRYCLALMVKEKPQPPPAVPPITLPASDVNVVVTAGTRTITATTTVISPELTIVPRFNAALDIGELLDQAGNDDVVLVNIYKGRSTAQARLPVDKLRNNIMKGIRAELIELELLPEWSQANSESSLGTVSYLHHTPKGTFAISGNQVFIDPASTRDFRPLGGALPENGRSLELCDNVPYVTTPKSLYRYDGLGWQQVIPTENGFNARSILVKGQRLIIGRGTSNNQIRVYDNCGSIPVNVINPILSNRPVSALAQSTNRMFAATEGEGIFYSDNNGEQWDQFNTPASDNTRISALTVFEDVVSCTVFATSSGTTPQLLERRCKEETNNPGEWTVRATLPTALPLVNDLVAFRSGDAITVFAVGSSGLFQHLAGQWVQRATGDLITTNLLTVAVQPTPYERRVWVGGLNTGVLIYRNIDPEVDVGVVVNPLAARPGEPITATITWRNIGGAPAQGVGLNVTVGSELQLVSSSVGSVTGNLASIPPTTQILPGETKVLTVNLNMLAPPSPFIVWPEEPQIDVAIVTSTVLVGDLIGNNSDQETVGSQPARAPDVSVTLLPISEIKPGVTVIRFNAQVDNQGELAATNVRLNLTTNKPGANLTPTTKYIGSVPGTEQDASCEPNRCKVEVKLTLPQALKLADRLLVTATLTMDAGDRVAANNTSDVLVNPDARAQYLVVTNLTRLETIEGGAQVNEKVRYAVQHLLAQSAVPVAWLQLDPSINIDLGKIDKHLANREYELAAKQTLNVNTIIRKEIFNWLKNNDPLRLYIKGILLVGGDRVIPYGIVPSDVRSAGDNLAEKAFAEDARNYPAANQFRLSPVYAALMQNYYPADDIYAIAPTINIVDKPDLPELSVARLVERSAHIHSQIEQFVDNPTVAINISDVGLVGYDPLLTKDQWEESQEAWNVLDPVSVPLARDFADEPRDTAILGGHGSINTIGDAGIDELSGTILKDTMPLVLTVSCHTGLSVRGAASLPEAILSAKPSGSASKRRAGGAYIASIPYAYGAIDTIEYNERIALIFQEIMLDKKFNGKHVSEIVLELKRRYVNDRGGIDKMKPLDWKVLWGLALYGMPMQSVNNPIAALQTGAAQAATTPANLVQVANTLLYRQPITLDAEYTRDETQRPNWPTSFRPEYGEGVEHVGRLGEHSTRQPRWRTIVEPITLPGGPLLVPRGVLFKGGLYDSIDNFDPFVTDALPLSSIVGPIHEPALPPLSGWEDSMLVEGLPLGTDRLSVQLWLGQFAQYGKQSLERLLRQTQLEVLYGPATGDRIAPKGKVAACQVGNGYNIVVRDQGAIGGQVVYTNADGTWQAVSFTRQYGLLVANIPGNTNLEFFVQLFDGEGDVATLTADSHQFYTPANTDCNGVYVERGDVAIYPFNENGGEVVHDVSTFGAPLNLVVLRPQNGSWGEGAYNIADTNALTSKNAATKINKAIQASGEFSVELWVTAAPNDQLPARLLTLSANGGQRNFSLSQGSFNGQQADLVGGRVRTTQTAIDGGPLLFIGGFQTSQLTHIVYTRAKNGVARLFINGVQVSEGNTGGSLANWSLNYPLSLGREANGGRDWRGSYHLVTIYKRALSPDDIGLAYLVGPERR